MSNCKTTNSAGLGFFGALTLLFIYLKLIGYIEWSWFWVLSPILIPIIFLVLVLICIVFLASVLDLKSDNDFEK